MTRCCSYLHRSMNGRPFHVRSPPFPRRVTRFLPALLPFFSGLRRPLRAAQPREFHLFSSRALVVCGATLAFKSQPINSRHSGQNPIPGQNPWYAEVPGSSFQRRGGFIYWLFFGSPMQLLTADPRRGLIAAGGLPGKEGETVAPFLRPHRAAA